MDHQLQNLAGLRLERMGLCAAGLFARFAAGLAAALAHIRRCLSVALNDGILDKGGVAGFKFQPCEIPCFHMGIRSRVVRSTLYRCNTGLSENHA